MNSTQQQLVEEVVEAFRASLSPEALAHIEPARFDDLAFVVSEALAEAVGSVVERMEDLLRELRKEAEKPELEL